MSIYRIQRKIHIDAATRELGRRPAQSHGEETLTQAGGEPAVWLPDAFLGRRDPGESRRLEERFIVDGGQEGQAGHLLRLDAPLSETRPPGGAIGFLKPGPYIYRSFGASIAKPKLHHHLKQNDRC